MPAETLAQSVSVPIWIAVFERVMVPLPSCPNWFQPHAQRVPFGLIARVWCSPTDRLFQSEVPPEPEPDCPILIYFMYSVMSSTK